MAHEPCQCPGPTRNCPRYGWMMGHKFETCRGACSAKRDKYLDAYLKSKDRPVIAPAAPSEPPSYWKRIANYMKAEAKHTFNLRRHVTEDVHVARLAVCHACPRFIDEKGVPTCSHPSCGCPVEVKASWKSERCPLLLWPGDNATQKPAKPCGGCGKTG